MSSDDLKIQVNGQTSYAYYLSDFSRTERFRLWVLRNRVLVSTMVATAAGAVVGVFIGRLA